MGKTNFDEIELKSVAAIASTNASVTATAVTAVGTADVGSAFNEAEVQAIQTLAAANKVTVNKLVTDITVLVTLVNEMKTQLNKVFKG